MGKLSLGRVLDRFCLSSTGSSSCFCMNSMENEDEFERSPLVTGEKDQFLRLKDVVAGKQTLAFQLKPKMVMLRVSMHCNGCARKVEKHISKIEDEFERSPLVTGEKDQFLRLKDVVAGKQTLAFQLKPKMVMLRVSMHCNGCARKVEKHISKIEGVTSYKVNLESKMVVVIGDVLPPEVLENVSKVKNAEIWNSPC